MLQKELQKIGLSDAESKVYLAALELGETNIGRLAKKSGIKRTTTYLVVDSLKEKGLLSSLKKKNKIFFYADDPRVLERITEERQNTINKIMPELLSFTNLIDKKPQIRYFEGIEGIKEVLKDVLHYPEQEMYSWFSESFATDFEEDFFNDYFIPQRKEKKIFAKVILPDTPIIRQLVAKDQEHLRVSKLLPADKYNINIEIQIYGNNKVSITSYEEKFSMIIESPKIHKSLKSIFEAMWGLIK